MAKNPYLTLQEQQNYFDSVINRPGFKEEDYLGGVSDQNKERASLGIYQAQERANERQRLADLKASQDSSGWMGSKIGGFARGITDTLAMVPEGIESVGLGAVNTVFGTEYDPRTLNTPFDALSAGVRGLGNLAPEVNPTYKDDYGQKFAAGLGSAVGFMPMALAGPAAGFALAGAAGAGEGQRDYEQSLAQQENNEYSKYIKGESQFDAGKQAINAFANTGIGMTELLPIERILKTARGPSKAILEDLVKGGIKNRAGYIARKGLEGAAIEGGQEMAAGILRDAVAKGVAQYDPERQWFSSTFDDATVGGGVGAFLNTIAAAYGIRSRGPIEQAVADNMPATPLQQAEVERKLRDQGRAYNPLAQTEVKDKELKTAFYEINRIDEMLQSGRFTGDIADKANQTVAEMYKRIYDAANLQPETTKDKDGNETTTELNATDLAKKQEAEELLAVLNSEQISGDVSPVLTPQQRTAEPQVDLGTQIPENETISYPGTDLPDVTMNPYDYTNAMDALNFGTEDMNSLSRMAEAAPTERPKQTVKDSRAITKDAMDVYGVKELRSKKAKDEWNLNNLLSMADEEIVLESTPTLTTEGIDVGWISLFDPDQHVKDFKANRIKESEIDFATRKNNAKNSPTPPTQEELDLAWAHREQQIYQESAEVLRKAELALTKEIEDLNDKILEGTADEVAATRILEEQAAQYGILASDPAFRDKRMKYQKTLQKWMPQIEEQLAEAKKKLDNVTTQLIKSEFEQQKQNEVIQKKAEKAAKKARKANAKAAQQQDEVYVPTDDFAPTYDGYDVAEADDPTVPRQVAIEDDPTVPTTDNQRIIDEAVALVDKISAENIQTGLANKAAKPGGIRKNPAVNDRPSYYLDNGNLVEKAGPFRWEVRDLSGEWISTYSTLKDARANESGPKEYNAKYEQGEVKVAGQTEYYVAEQKDKMTKEEIRKTKVRDNFWNKDNFSSRKAIKAAKAAKLSEADMNRVPKIKATGKWGIAQVEIAKANKGKEVSPRALDSLSFSTSAVESYAYTSHLTLEEFTRSGIIPSGKNGKYTKKDVSDVIAYRASQNVALQEVKKILEEEASIGYIQGLTFESLVEKFLMGKFDLKQITEAHGLATANKVQTWTAEGTAMWQAIEDAKKQGNTAQEVKDIGKSELMKLSSEDRQKVSMVGKAINNLRKQTGSQTQSFKENKGDNYDEMVAAAQKKRSEEEAVLQKEREKEAADKAARSELSQTTKPSKVVVENQPISLEAKNVGVTPEQLEYGIQKDFDRMKAAFQAILDKTGTEQDFYDVIHAVTEEGKFNYSKQSAEEVGLSPMRQQTLVYAYMSELTATLRNLENNVPNLEPTTSNKFVETEMSDEASSLVENIMKEHPNYTVDDLLNHSTIAKLADIDPTIIGHIEAAYELYDGVKPDTMSKETVQAAKEAVNLRKNINNANNPYYKLEQRIAEIDEYLVDADIFLTTLKNKLNKGVRATAKEVTMAKSLMERKPQLKQERENIIDQIETTKREMAAEEKRIAAIKKQGKEIDPKTLKDSDARMMNPNDPTKGYGHSQSTLDRFKQEVKDLMSKFPGLNEGDIDLHLLNVVADLNINDVRFQHAMNRGEANNSMPSATIGKYRNGRTLLTFYVDYFPNSNKLLEAVYHELVGHYGMDKLFNGQYHNFLRKTADLNKAFKFQALRDRFPYYKQYYETKRGEGKYHPFNHEGKTYWISERNLGNILDEYVANRASTIRNRRDLSNPKKGIGKVWDQISKWVKHQLRKLFTGKNGFTEEDVDDLIVKSYRKLQGYHVVTGYESAYQAEIDTTLKDTAVTMEDLNGRTPIEVHEVQNLFEDIKKLNPESSIGIDKLRQQNFSTLNDRFASKYWNRFEAWMQHNPIMKKLYPMGGLTQTELYETISREVLGINDRVERFGSEFSKMFKNSSKAKQDAMYKWFIGEETDINLSTTNPVEQRMMKESRQLIDNLGGALVDMGILDKDIYEANKGKYLMAKYLRYINRGRSQGKTLSFMGYLKEKDSDMAIDTAINLGKITDPGYLVSNTIMTLGRDLAVSQLLNNISQVSTNQSNGWTVNDRVSIPGFKKTMKFEDVIQTIEMKKREQTEVNFPLKDRDILQAEIDVMEKSVELYLAERNESLRKLAELHGEVDNFIDETGLFNDASFLRKNYVQISNSEYKFGALRGTWVRKEIYNDLIDTFTAYDQSSDAFSKISKSLEQGHALWKMAKVPFNIPSWPKNFMGNMTLLDISTSTPFHRLAKMLYEEIKALITNTPSKYTDMARSMGLYGATFSQQEIKNVFNNLDEGTKARLRTIGTEKSDIVSMFSRGFWDLAELASTGYGYLEGVFKTVAMRDYIENQWERQNGVKIDSLTREQRQAIISEAAAHANDAIFDYSKVPPTVRKLRRWPLGAPFLTFTYKALPATLRGLARNPQKFIKYAAIPSMLAAMGSADMSDEEYEELLRNLPDYAKTNGSLYLTPWKLENGKRGWFDYGFMLPWGAYHTMFNKTVANMKEGTGVEGALTGGVKSVLDIGNEFGFLGGLVPTAIQAISTNRDAFTGKDIITPGASSSQRFAEGLTYTWTQAMPGWMGSYGLMSHLFDMTGIDAAPYFKNRMVDKFGEQKMDATGVLMGDVLGFKTQYMSDDKNRFYSAKSHQKKMKEFQTNISNIMKDRSLGPEGKARMIKEQNLARKHYLETRWKKQSEPGSSELITPLMRDLLK